MSRKKRVIHRRETEPDPRYRNVVITQMIHRIMERGKKNTAQLIVYDALEIIQKRTKQNPLEVLQTALDNVRPLVEVKPRRVGGATYQVPIEVRSGRGLALAVRWIVQFARLRKGKPMSERMADEILEASRKEGSAVKKREDTHRMAEANKAFAHYRW